ncbi:MAG: endonuclease/exonuclease/phosphatase family protein [Melioribacteraceae bacterium]|nr:endonuclease/exonuclease/phosphatase family protein [Melioribacteraceae bacterium]MCF8266000.1 endonuclease/exonuclease/phosphatase family protein [Melioribacteraceae bacterium]
MKKVFFTTMLSFLLVSCNSHVNETYQIISFNIRYGSADDGDNSWEFRKSILFEYLKSRNVDIIGAQEVLDFQIDEILEQLPNMDYVGVGREDGKNSGEYSPIFYNKNKFKLMDGNTFWFSDTPDVVASKSWGNNYTRICTWAKFKTPKGEESIFVFNVHLDHESQNSREKSVDLLITKISEIAGVNPVIITGDFNAGESNPAILNMKNNFVDTYRIKNPKTEVVGTFNEWIGEDSKEKLDYVFVNNRLSVAEAAINKFNRNGKYPSDHFPVSASVKIKKPSED